MQAPSHLADIERMAFSARPADDERDAAHRVLRAAFSVEKLIGAQRTAAMLRAAAEALESGRTPLLF